MQAGDHITITGNGSSQNPFVIGSDIDFDVLDNSTFNLVLSGLGTIANPWVIQVQYASTAKLDDLPDVNAPTPTNAQVLGWDSATSKWTARNPTTAAAGSVTTDTTLTGDGSGGSPLSVREDPAGLIDEGASGIKITDAGLNQMVRRFGTSAARVSATPAPVLNALSALDTAPGEVDYWTGTQWKPIAAGLNGDYGTEMLALSGSYAGSIVKMVTRNISFTTDSVGGFTVLSSTDLAGLSGVLSVQLQETGSVPWKGQVYAQSGQIQGTAYRLDTGAAYAAQVLTATVVALVY